MLGVIYETGSGKYLRFHEDDGIPGTQFHSSWQNASQIEYSKWVTDKYGLLDRHNADWYAATCKFFPLKVYHKVTDREYTAPDFERM